MPETNKSESNFEAILGKFILEFPKRARKDINNDNMEEKKIYYFLTKTNKIENYKTFNQLTTATKDNNNVPLGHLIKLVESAIDKNSIDFLKFLESGYYREKMTAAKGKDDVKKRNKDFDSFNTRFKHLVLLFQIASENTEPSEIREFVERHRKP